MGLSKHVAEQLSNASYMVGRFLAGPLWNRRNAKLNDVAIGKLALTPHDRLLEVGFGGGYLLDRVCGIVSEGFVAGVDASPSMVAFCERRFRSRIRDGHLDLRCARAGDLPYTDGQFTKAGSVNSIFYWRDAALALAGLHRVLAPGGELVVCYTSSQCLADRSFAKHGMTLYQAGDIEQMMALAGFCDIQTQRFSDKHRAFRATTGSG